MFVLFAKDITSHNASWENYEGSLDLLGEADGPLISDNEGGLQVLTPISTGENKLIFGASTWTVARLCETDLTDEDDLASPSFLCEDQIIAHFPLLAIRARFVGHLERRRRLAFVSESFVKR